MELPLVEFGGFPFPLGAVWLDHDARVISRNHIAGTILDERDGLLLSGGRLVAARSHEAFELNRLLRSASANGNGCDVAAGMMRISRSSRRRPITLLVSPLRWPGLRERADIPAAIVFMTDPDREPPTWQELLRRLYGLTRTEADVAHLVLKGGRIEHIARQRGTSRNTARTHLRRICGKVGVQSQLDLIRALLAGAVMLAAIVLSSPSDEVMLADVLSYADAALSRTDGS